MLNEFSRDHIASDFFHRFLKFPKRALWLLKYPLFLFWIRYEAFASLTVSLHRVCLCMTFNFHTELSVSSNLLLPSYCLSWHCLSFTLFHTSCSVKTAGWVYHANFEMSRLVCYLNDVWESIGLLFGQSLVGSNDWLSMLWYYFCLTLSYYHSCCV